MVHLLKIETETPDFQKGKGSAEHVTQIRVLPIGRSRDPGPRSWCDLGAASKMTNRSPRSGASKPFRKTKIGKKMKISLDPRRSILEPGNAFFKLAIATSSCMQANSEPISAKDGSNGVSQTSASPLLRLVAASTVFPGILEHIQSCSMQSVC